MCKDNPYVDPDLTVMDSVMTVLNVRVVGQQLKTPPIIVIST